VKENPDQLTAWDRAIPRLISVRYELIPTHHHPARPYQRFLLELSLVNRLPSRRFLSVTTYFEYSLN
jgi:hypothetical protein